METPKNNIRNKKRSPLKTPSDIRKEKLQVLSTTELIVLQNELLLKEKKLDEEISQLADKGFDTDLSAEMQALHKYNDMKDLSQVVLGYLGDVEQITVTDLHKRYNLPTD